MEDPFTENWAHCFRLTSSNPTSSPMQRLLALVFISILLTCPLPHIFLWLIHVKSLGLRTLYWSRPTHLVLLDTDTSFPYMHLKKIVPCYSRPIDLCSALLSFSVPFSPLLLSYPLLLSLPPSLLSLLLSSPSPPFSPIPPPFLPALLSLILSSLSHPFSPSLFSLPSPLLLSPPFSPIPLLSYLLFSPSFSLLCCPLFLSYAALSSSPIPSSFLSLLLSSPSFSLFPPLSSTSLLSSPFYPPIPSLLSLILSPILPSPLPPLLSPLLTPFFISTPENFFQTDWILR